LRLAAPSIVDNSASRKFAPFLRSWANNQRMLTISGFITRYRQRSRGDLRIPKATRGEIEGRG
jgi:hypothetical protein